MTNQVTVDNLLEMRLSAMSDAFLIQMNDPQMQEVPFEDRFGMLKIYKEDVTASLIRNP